MCLPTMSRRAAQMSRLQESTSSDVSLTQIGGRRAYSFEVDGMLSGARIKYLVTIIEGTDQLVTVITWTSAANFATQATLMIGREGYGYPVTRADSPSVKARVWSRAH